MTALRDPKISLGVEGGERECSKRKRGVVTFEMGRRDSRQMFSINFPL